MSDEPVKFCVFCKYYSYEVKNEPCKSCENLSNWEEKSNKLYTKENDGLYTFDVNKIQKDLIFQFGGENLIVMSKGKFVFKGQEIDDANQVYEKMLDFLNMRKEKKL